MPQSQRLRQEYLRLARALLQHERAERERLLGGSPGALKRHLEWIDRVREGTRALEGAAATPLPEDPLAAEVEALEQADHVLQPWLDDTAATVDRAIARAGRSVPVETYTCALPTGMFNAQARAVPGGGVLIMVNSGLVSLLFGASQILAHAASFEDPTGLGRPLYTDAQVSTAFTGLLVAYVVFGDARESNWFLPQGGVRGQLAAALFSSAQVFAVAHEFGHVIGGHLGGPAKQLPRPGWEDVDVAAKEVEQEREADRLASTIITHLEGVDSDPTAPSMVAAGPAIFFALAHSVESARERMRHPGPSPNADHPPPDERWAAIRAELERRLPGDSFVLAENARRWIKAETARTLSDDGLAASARRTPRSRAAPR